MLLNYVCLHICILFRKKKKTKQKIPQKQEVQETSSRQTALMRLLTEGNRIYLLFVKL